MIFGGAYLALQVLFQLQPKHIQQPARFAQMGATPRQAGLLSALAANLACTPQGANCAQPVQRESTVTLMEPQYARSASLVLSLKNNPKNAVKIHAEQGHTCLPTISDARHALLESTPSMRLRNAQSATKVIIARSMAPRHAAPVPLAHTHRFLGPRTSASLLISRSGASSACRRTSRTSRPRSKMTSSRRSKQRRQRASMCA